MELYIDFSNRQRKEKVDDALRGLVMMQTDGKVTNGSQVG